MAMLWLLPSAAIFYGDRIEALKKYCMAEIAHFFPKFRVSSSRVIGVLLRPPGQPGQREILLFFGITVPPKKAQMNSFTWQNTPLAMLLGRWVYKIWQLLNTPLQNVTWVLRLY